MKSETHRAAREATALLIKASLRHPAHVTEQARYIARECQRRELDSTHLGESLIDSPGFIRAVVKTANFFHRRSGVKEIHALSVRSVVRQTFGC